MINVEPIRKQVLVRASQSHAFRVFTSGIDRWWPRQHHIGKSPLKRAVLEAKLDGRWYSLCEDGSECDVGRVLVWDPPRRLVLAWQINAEWCFDPDFVTEIEVNFFIESSGTTRVELEHRNLDRYGAAAADFKKALGSPDGWTGTLTSFAMVASSVA